MTTATKKQTPWITGWDLDNPLKLKTDEAPLMQAEWKSGVAPYFEYRNLNLDRASGGKFGGWHVRAIEKSSDWQADDVDFNQLYVVKGIATVKFEDGTTEVLKKDTSAVIPPLYRYRFEDISEDFEALQFVAPSEYDIIWGENSDLPERVSTLDADRAPVILHEDDESWGKGLREFFEYRDLGTIEVTDGRVYTHAIRALGAYEAGTGWHYHSWGQCFVVLGGYADIRVETDPRKALATLDAFCVGAGPENRHFVDRVTEGYKLIELCIPGWKDATPVDAPEGSAY